MRALGLILAMAGLAGAPPAHAQGLLPATQVPGETGPVLYAGSRSVFVVPVFQASGAVYRIVSSGEAVHAWYLPSPSAEIDAAWATGTDEAWLYYRPWGWEHLGAQAKPIGSATEVPCDGREVVEAVGDTQGRLWMSCRYGQLERLERDGNLTRLLCAPACEPMQDLAPAVGGGVWGIPPRTSDTRFRLVRFGEDGAPQRILDVKGDPPSEVIDRGGRLIVLAESRPAIYDHNEANYDGASLVASVDPGRATSTARRLVRGLSGDVGRIGIANGGLFGPDASDLVVSHGDVWFVEDGYARVARLTRDGRILEFELTPNRARRLVTSGDGRLWALGSHAVYSGRPFNESPPYLVSEISPSRSWRPSLPVVQPTFRLRTALSGPATGKLDAISVRSGRLLNGSAVRVTCLRKCLAGARGAVVRNGAATVRPAIVLHRRSIVALTFSRAGYRPVSECFSFVRRDGRLVVRTEAVNRVLLRYDSNYPFDSCASRVAG